MLKYSKVGCSSGVSFRTVKSEQDSTTYKIITGYSCCAVAMTLTNTVPRKPKINEKKTITWISSLCCTNNLEFIFFFHFWVVLYVQEPLLSAAVIHYIRAPGTHKRLEHQGFCGWFKFLWSFKEPASHRLRKFRNCHLNLKHLKRVVSDILWKLLFLFSLWFSPTLYHFIIIWPFQHSVLRAYSLVSFSRRWRGSSSHRKPCVNF